MNYLTLDGMKHLLSVIPTNTRRGRRNLALLSTLYETGARVQELIGLRPVDISLNQPFFLIIEVVNKKQWTITIVVLIVIVHCGSVIVEPLA
uniref:tyrosine-type recombinase/integrase n=1 Tax=Prevotella sp. TaxID=59823 RepID=UPI00307A9C5D